MTTELNDKTIVACNPLGIGRTVPGKCVSVALAFIGSGKTVEEYQKHMKSWVDNHPAPHLCFPGGGSAMGVLRYLVDTNKKAVVIDKMPALPKKAAKKAAPRKRKAKVKEAPVETVEQTAEAPVETVEQTAGE
jgi:hypothetical protein